MGKLSRENMPNAYKEVHEILKYVGEEERNLIPESFYNFLPIAGINIIYCK